MLGVEWEIKSPDGNSKNTIGRVLRKAAKQSKNIVIDGNHTSLTDAAIKKTLLFELGKRREIKKVLLITKEKIVVEIK